MAMNWYTKAAQAGNSYALYNLGHLYENGLGVPKDTIKAYAWYSAAVASAPTNKSFQDAKANIYTQIGADKRQEAEQTAQSYVSKYVSTGAS